MTVKLLPPNHAERPDWQFFSDLLGRECAPVNPIAVSTACRRLKALLVEVYVNHFDKLFAACARGGAASVIHDCNFRGNQREEWIQFFKDKLIMPLNGQIDTKRIKDKRRGYSGNAVTYWEPDRCGIVPYITARLNYVWQSLSETNKPYSNDVSLDALAEMRIEPSTDGKWIRNVSTDDAPNYIEHDFSAEREEAEELQYA